MKYLPLATGLDRWFANGVAASGVGVVLCRRGCAACCHGPFDISPADAELVARGIGQLESTARQQVELRAVQQVARYREWQPGWRAPWDTEVLTERAFDNLVDALADVPCPALGDDGACLIYEHRPVTCRMTGLPMLAGNATLENVCPIVNTSPAYAAVAPVPFDMADFENRADECDAAARQRGYVTTTVAGAIMSARQPAAGRTA